MTRVKWLLAFVVLVSPFSLGAQTAPANELGVFASVSSFGSTSITDAEFDLVFEFDEDVGYGVSYNRFWTNRFSTELSVQKLGADLEVTVSDGAPSVVVATGEVDLTAYSATAQWHFARSGRISPYVGGGIAHVAGDVKLDPDPDDPGANENLDLDSETTWLVNAGVTFGINDAFAVSADAKYIPYETKVEGDTSSDRIDIDVLVFSAVLKWRF